MGVGLQLYLAAWLSVLLAGAVVAVRYRRALGLFGRAYWSFLLVPWKLVMFAVGLVGIVAIAPWTGDPTWDAVDASVMATLTFATAPWTVGVLYRAVLRRARPGRAAVFVALVAWFFSAAWSYDGWLLLRDGVYPSTWSVNLLPSGCLYLLAGLFWSFEWTPARGTHLAFQESEWPVRSRAPFGRVALWCLPVAVGVAALFASTLFL